MELLKVSYPRKTNRQHQAHLLQVINHCKAAVVGPGLSTSKESAGLLKALLSAIEVPVVLDADALNLLAQKDYVLPTRCLLTPHVGEMARLLGLEKTPVLDLGFLAKCQKYADKKHVTLVLKGAPTFIFHPFKTPSLSIKGDPGMASAGSGDVLSGILGALLAQGLETRDAALLGVFLHGLAGERAAREKTSHCMIASDIIRSLPSAFRRLLA